MDIKIKSRTIVIVLLAVITSISGFAQAAEQPASKLTFISNVNVFDGKTEKLHENMYVLVKDNLIETVSNEPLAVIQTDNVTMIDGGGRTLMPGVIEKGTYADLILVDGNPLDNIDLVADAEKNFVMIMKDGTVYKNTIQ